MDWSLEYRPGTSVLIVSGQRLVVLPGDGAWEMPGRLWELAKQGAGILDLLETLSAHGLAAVPDAAVAVEDLEGCVVLLRGTVAAQADGQIIDATGRYTWTEAQVDVGEFRVMGEGVEPQALNGGVKDSSGWLPIQSGVVLCSQVRVARREVGQAVRDHDGRSASTEQAAPAGIGIGRVAEVAAEAEPLGETVEGSAPSGGVSAEPRDEASARRSVAAAGDSGTDDLPKPDVLRVDPQRPELDVPDEGERRGSGPEESDSAGPGQAPVPDRELEDEYDRLFGETSLVNRGPSAAAVGDAALQDGEEAGAASEKTPGGGDAETAVLTPADPPPPESGPAARTAPGSSESGGLIEVVPGMLGGIDSPERETVVGTQPPASAPVQASTPADDDLHGDHDGRTTIRPSRAHLPAAAASVRAIVCSQGHANPPEAVACRVCRMDIGDVPIQTIVRPSMGVLRLADSVPGAPDSVDLDRNVVIGRRPHHSATTDPSDRLVVVDVPGGEMSRNHVRVTIEGWHVLVTDLGSTNGTVLTAPGSDPVRLRGQDATPISAGSSITLAETVTYRFEVG